jgi:hypothetical protein
MGIYSHLTIQQLETQRAELSAALQRRLTQPSSASSNGRSISYQQQIADIRRELLAINAELAHRCGQRVAGPIYLV